MEKILILGASGLVGKALITELNGKYDVYGTYNSKRIEELKDKGFKFNVDNYNKIKEILDKVKPKLIISCLRGDFEKQLQTHKTVANYIKDVNGTMYFCSTANVFDGDTTTSKYENDERNAKSDYGKYKIQCEELLEETIGNNAVILRLPMILGKNSRRINELIQNLENNEEIELFTNLFITTNTDVMLAKQIHYLIKNNLKGIFHLATDDVIVYKDFIKKLIKEWKYENAKIKEVPIMEKDYYLAILSKKNELPNDLRITNKDVLDYLFNL